MSHAHHHAHHGGSEHGHADGDGRAHRHHAPQRAQALAPTWSLLRLSAAARLAGAACVLAVLWAAVLAVTGAFPG